MSIATIATQLNMPVSVLRKESIRDFLERRLLAVETELFSLVSKYGVKGIQDLDNKIKKGLVHETTNTREDFFELDSLESRRDTLRKLIKSL